MYERQIYKTVESGLLSAKFGNTWPKQICSAPLHGSRTNLWIVTSVLSEEAAPREIKNRPFNLTMVKVQKVVFSREKKKMFSVWIRFFRGLNWFGYVKKRKGYLLVEGEQ